MISRRCRTDSIKKVRDSLWVMIGSIALAAAVLCTIGGVVWWTLAEPRDEEKIARAEKESLQNAVDDTVGQTVYFKDPRSPLGICYAAVAKRGPLVDDIRIEHTYVFRIDSSTRAFVPCERIPPELLMTARPKSAPAPATVSK